MTSYRQEKDTKPSNYKLFEPTPKLRWQLRGENWDVKVLQQLWVERFTQAEQWRDIPTE